MKVSLLPSTLIGRYYQALVLYLSDLKVERYGTDYIEIEENEEELYEGLCNLIEEYYKKYKYLERMPSGNDTHFVEKIMGTEKWQEYQEKRNKIRSKREDANAFTKEFWCKLLEYMTVKSEETVRRIKNRPPTRLMMVKLNLGRHVKTFMVPSRTERDNKMVYVINNKETLLGEALAITGLIVSNVGFIISNNDGKRSYRTEFRVLPPLPESLRETMKNHVAQRYWAMVENRPSNPKNLPVSTDVYLHFHYSHAFVKAKVFQQGSVCMNPLDALILTFISKNEKKREKKPMVSNAFPLISSEIFCKFYRLTGDEKRANYILSHLLSLLWTKSGNGEVQACAGECLNDLYQYVISSNVQKLYDCSRRLAALSITGKLPQELRNRVEWLRRSLGYVKVRNLWP
ncbi:hypothetical protein EYM_02730 [Ignicoccus islandicus DSM 13165]|uniref:Uncharacterized protein n=1 Tax=Ignicoccus islandicus DSM 13165 TaxID=940295 RepID=A0A0U2WN18_9CREN|nr:hypothetical protein [Ignicoccus islandicus]ALU12353.1 hypothetical protein EYM_02730 [Ignicoccus islandicus DSM 13165]